MRILFMGTPDFAVPSLEALVAAGHEVCGVFSQPDKPVGRHQNKTKPTPVKASALAHDIPVFQPETLRDGAALEQLRAMGLQLALASSSPMSNIRQVLGECGLMEFFPVIVSGEQFEASKPDPEIYLHTMARLGRRPEECLIVEDSTYGVQAGAAAGGLVAALRDERFPFDQSAARFHIGNLSEIPALAASIQ